MTSSAAARLGGVSPSRSAATWSSTKRWFPRIASAGAARRYAISSASLNSASLVGSLTRTNVAFRGPLERLAPRRNRARRHPSSRQRRRGTSRCRPGRPSDNVVEQFSKRGWQCQRPPGHQRASGFPGVVRLACRGDTAVVSRRARRELSQQCLETTASMTVFVSKPFA